MPTSASSFLCSVKRSFGRLAIGQILREEYVYEVHGPFLVAPPVQRRRLFDRIAGGLSTSVSDLACRLHLHRRSPG